MAPLPLFEHLWQTGTEFLSQFESDDGGLGSFFLPLADGALPPEGTLVMVCLRFADRQAEFRAHARVQEQIEGADRGLRLRFVERGRQQLVVTCAEGRSLRYFRRRYARLACYLPVEVTLASGATFPATATAIAEGGVGLLAADCPANEGDALEVAIAFPGTEEALLVSGRVVALVGGPEPGLSIEFVFASRQQRDGIWQAVSRLRQDSSDP